MYTVVVICLFVQIVIITADYQTFLQIIAAVMYSMALLGMNTYIYAPKDDLKHRIHWRDMYSVDEAGTASLHHTCYYFVIYFCPVLAIINITWLLIYCIIC